jgi:hypothetical protein
MIVLTLVVYLISPIKWSFHLFWVFCWTIVKCKGFRCTLGSGGLDKGWGWWAWWVYALSRKEARLVWSRSPVPPLKLPGQFTLYQAAQSHTAAHPPHPSWFVNIRSKIPLRVPAEAANRLSRQALALLPVSLSNSGIYPGRSSSACRLSSVRTWSDLHGIASWNLSSACRSEALVESTLQASISQAAAAPRPYSFIL